MGRSYADIKYDLWYNLEKWVSPDNIALALKGNPGNKIFSYGNHPLVCENNGSSFQKEKTTLTSADKDFISLPTGENKLKIIGKSITIVFKFKPLFGPSFAGYPFLIDNSATSAQISNANGYRLFWNDAVNAWRFRFFTSSGNYNVDAVTSSWSSGDDLIVIATYDGNYGKVYADGLATGSTAASGDLTTQNHYPFIGRSSGNVSNNDGFSAWLNGQIYSCFIFDSVVNDSFIDNAKEILKTIWQPRPDIPYFDMAQSGLLPIELIGVSASSSVSATPGTLTINKKAALSGISSTAITSSVPGTLIANTASIGATCVGISATSLVTSFPGTLVAGRAIVLIGTSTTASTIATSGTTIIGKKLVLVGVAATASVTASTGTLIAGEAIPFLALGLGSTSQVVTIPGTIVLGVITRAPPAIATSTSVPGTMIRGQVLTGPAALSTAFAVSGTFFNGIGLIKPIQNTSVQIIPLNNSIQLITLNNSISEITNINSIIKIA